MSSITNGTPTDQFLPSERERFLTYDQQEMIQKLGLKADGQRILIRFFSQDYVLQRSSALVFTGDHLASPEEARIIYAYLTYSSKMPSQTGEWLATAKVCPQVNLSSYAKELACFEGNLSALKEACHHLSGDPSSSGDVSFLFTVFPGLPVWFQYWDKEDEFDSDLQLLWDSSVTEFLPPDAITAVIEYLIHRLLTEGGFAS